MREPIVVINKIDRENARPHKVLDMVFDLFRRAQRYGRAARFSGYLRQRERGIRDAGDPRDERQHGAAIRGDH